MKAQSIYRITFLLLLAGSIFAQTPVRLTIDAIEIQGARKTRPHVIRAYLTFSEGDQVTRTQIEASEANLRNTNFFKQASIRLIPTEQPGHARAIINIKERTFPLTFQFKSGFNELDGWYISPLGLRLDNLFGRGNHLGMEMLIGDRVTGTELEFVRPFLWGSEYNLEFKLFGYNRDFVHFLSDEALPDNEFRQQVRDSGLKIQLRGNSGLARFFSLAFQAHNVDADSTLKFANEEIRPNEIPAPRFLTAASDTVQIRRLILAATVDTRDRKIHPSRGWWGSLSYDQASRDLGSYKNFYRLIFDLRRYQRLWKKVILAGRVKWGRVSEVAPFYERFYLGGPNSLRGYDDRSLTPEGYATQLSQGSAELRFPLSRKLRDSASFTGVLFYDAGYAWSQPDKWQRRRLKTSLGYGFRVRLPIFGLIRLDFAYPIPDYELHVHLSLGHTF